MGVLCVMKKDCSKTQNKGYFFETACMFSADPTKKKKKNLGDLGVLD